MNPWENVLSPLGKRSCDEMVRRRSIFQCCTSGSPFCSLSWISFVLPFSDINSMNCKWENGRYHQTAIIPQVGSPKPTDAGWGSLGSMCIIYNKENTYCDPCRILTSKAGLFLSAGLAWLHINVKPSHTVLCLLWDFRWVMSQNQIIWRWGPSTCDANHAVRSITRTLVIFRTEVVKIN